MPSEFEQSSWDIKRGNNGLVVKPDKIRKLTIEQVKARRSEPYFNELLGILEVAARTKCCRSGEVCVQTRFDDYDVGLFLNYVARPHCDLIATISDYVCSFSQPEMHATLRQNIDTILSPLGPFIPLGFHF